MVYRLLLIIALCFTPSLCAAGELADAEPGATDAAPLIQLPPLPDSNEASTSSSPSPTARPLGRPRSSRSDHDTSSLSVSPRSTNASTAGATTPPADSWQSAILRTSFSLALVLLLIFACAAIARKVLGRAGVPLIGGAGGRGGGATGPSGICEVLARYPFARGCTLVLLRVDRRVLLLAQGGTSGAGGSLLGAITRRGGGSGGVGPGLSTLAEFTDPEEVASLLTKAQDDDSTSLSSRFQSMLRQYHAGTRGAWGSGGGGGDPYADAAIIEVPPSRPPTDPLTVLRSRFVRLTRAASLGTVSGGGANR